jgi:hypothetical protein
MEPMFGSAPKSSPSPSPSLSQKPSGTIYDLVRVTELDGKKAFQNLGTVFIRGNGTGGVLYTKGDDGQKLELAIFARKPRFNREA